MDKERNRQRWERKNHYRREKTDQWKNKKAQDLDAFDREYEAHEEIYGEKEAGTDHEPV